MLFERSARRFGTLAAVPSNVQAIEAALLFSCGLQPFVVLLGPSGWGKTHLLESASFSLVQESRHPAPILNATDWLKYPHLVDPSQPLLLDDAQDAYLKTRTKVQLRLALERRLRAGRPTLLSFTASRPTRQLRANLPSPHVWTIATMTEPALPERLVIVNQMAQAEGLTLSTTLARLLAERMNGNGRTLIGALKRLRLHGALWLDGRAALKAAGVLNCFFSDNSAWDLKERMTDAAGLTRGQLAGLPVLELLTYAMLHEACLPEAEVARFLDVTPATAYQTSSAFRARMDKDETAELVLNQYIDQVVELLVRD